MKRLFLILTIVLLLTINVFAGGIGAPPMAGDCTKDCNFDGTTTFAGDITSTGDLSGEDINVGGVWLLEVQNCTGQATDSCCYNGTQLICKKSDDETVDALDTGAGSGYWSISGSDIFYSAGLVSIGSETDSNSQFLITTPVATGVDQSMKILNTQTTVGINYGLNITLDGAASTNTALYLWTDNGTVDNFAIKVDKGDVVFDEDLYVAGTTYSDAVDGEHYVNFCNTIAFSGTPAEGDITCNSTTNISYMRFDAAWVYMPTRIFTAVEPGNPCVEGEPDRFYTTTDTYYICQGTVWHFETFAD